MESSLLFQSNNEEVVNMADAKKNLKMVRALAYYQHLVAEGNLHLAADYINKYMENPKYD